MSKNGNKNNNMALAWPDYVTEWRNSVWVTFVPAALTGQSWTTS